MVLRRVLRPAVAGALLMIGGQATSAQRQPALAALNAIEPGQWQLRQANGQVRKLCITNPAVLLQIFHGNTQCEHFVMEDTPKSATIRYTCPAHGHGRTSISVETPRLVRIDTQGVANGAPFSEEFEGRRAGACN